HVQAMIDSGATSSFIHQDLVAKSKLRTTLKAKPRRVEVIDGRDISSGPITHECRVNLQLGQSQQQATLDVTDLGTSDLILGVPWVRANDRIIQWSEDRVQVQGEVIQGASPLAISTEAMRRMARRDGLRVFALRITDLRDPPTKLASTGPAPDLRT